MKKTSKRIVGIALAALLIAVALAGAASADDASGTGNDHITEINTVEDLVKFANAVNGGDEYIGETVTLTADINLSGISDWTPIGTEKHPFSGSFEGNGHTISNLKITSGNDYAGLFGYVRWHYNSESITSLSLENCDIKGGFRVGGIVGYFCGQNYSTINNKITECRVSGTISGDDEVGGIAGNCYCVLITDCRVSETKISGNENVGGIAGYSERTNITGCHVSGTISGKEDVGGIAGDFREGELRYCSVSGTVAGTGECVGGIVGYNKVYYYHWEVVEYCYSAADVTGSYKVGGICGYLHRCAKISGEDANIHNCYSTGDITATSGRCGGIVGEVNCVFVFSISSADGPNDESDGEYDESDGEYNDYAVRYCYATGSVVTYPGEGDANTGGIVGYAHASNAITGITIRDCVALNKKVSSVNGIAGKITSVNKKYVDWRNNYAWDNMPLEYKEEGVNEQNSVSQSEVWDTDVTAENTPWYGAGFDANVWRKNYDNNDRFQLPVLIKLGDDDISDASHLDPKSLQIVTVSFNMQNKGEAIPSQRIAKGNTAVKPADPTAAGYDFGGWYTTEECTGDAYDFNTAVTADMTLYARWTRQVACTVFMADYAYGNAGTPTITPETAAKFYYSDSATASGNEWSAEAGNLLNVGTYYMYAVVDGKETLKTTFKVTQEDQSKTPEFTVTDEDGIAYVSVADDYRDIVYRYQSGSEVSGWIPVPSDTFAISGLKAGSTYTLSMKYKESLNYFEGQAVSKDFSTGEMFSVSYNANGGNGAPLTQTGYNAITIPVNQIPTYANHTFTAWNTASDGSGTSYQPGDTVTTGAVLYAQWKDTPYQVKYHANGGTGSMDADEFQPGTPQALSSSTFTREGYTFAGWAKSADGAAVYADRQKVCDIGTGIVTLYAVWTAQTATVEGTIAGATGAVKVELRTGTTTVIGSVTVSDSFCFKKVPNGTYNIVAVNGDKTVTSIVVVSGESESVNLVFPTGDVSSKVVVQTANDTPAVVVGNLDQEAETKVEDGKTVVINMTVEAKVMQDVPENAEQKEKETQVAISSINEKVSGDATVTYLDVTVTKKVDEEDAEKITKTSTVIELVVPYDVKNAKTVTIYKNHEGSTTELTPLSTKPETVDETVVNHFYVDRINNDKIYIYVNEFSLYAIATSESVTPRTGSSSTVTSFTGEKNGSNFTFSNAVVATKAVLPGATSASITNISGNGWYNFDLTAPGFTGNGVLYFQVPLDVLEVKGFTTDDVGLYHYENGSWELKPTTFLKKDNQYAYYSATFDSCSPFMIDFEEGATETTAVEKIQESVEQKQEAAEKVQDVVEQIQTEVEEKQTAAKSPFPVLGILAGIGAAAFFLRRR